MDIKKHLTGHKTFKGKILVYTIAGGQVQHFVPIIINGIFLTIFFHFLQNILQDFLFPPKKIVF
jgi:hypothetical protein